MTTKEAIRRELNEINQILLYKDSHKRYNLFENEQSFEKKYHLQLVGDYDGSKPIDYYFDSKESCLECLKAVNEALTIVQTDIIKV